MGAEVVGGGLVKFFLYVSYGEDGENFELVWELISKLEKSLWEQHLCTKVQCSWGAMPCQKTQNPEYITSDQLAWFVELACAENDISKVLENIAHVESFLGTEIIPFCSLEYQYAPAISEYSEFCPNFWGAVVEAWCVKAYSH